MYKFFKVHLYKIFSSKVPTWSSDSYPTSVQNIESISLGYSKDLVTLP
jgi:hypothetical protein